MRILPSDISLLAKTEAVAGGGLGVGQAQPKTAEPVPWAPYAHAKHSTS